MKIEDNRKTRCRTEIRDLYYGDVFEFEQKIYQKVKSSNARSVIFVDGMGPCSRYCNAVNLKSGTIRPLECCTEVQMVRGRVVIERNS